jgi:hypothetical protein
MPYSAEPLWRLVDGLQPVPFRIGGEEVPIRSVQQLVEALRKFAAQKPRVLILTKRNGPQMFIGLAGKLAAVHIYPVPSNHRSWFASSDTAYSSEELWITSEGEPSWFPAAGAMPVETVIQLVAHVVEHDELPGKVKWVKVNGQVLQSLHDGAFDAGECDGKEMGNRSGPCE